jgi:hypothetical protein
MPWHYGSGCPQVSWGMPVAARLVQAVGRARQAPTFRRRCGRGGRIDPGTTMHAAIGPIADVVRVTGITSMAPPARAQDPRLRNDLGAQGESNPVLQRHCLLARPVGAAEIAARIWVCASSCRRPDLCRGARGGVPPRAPGGRKDASFASVRRRLVARSGGPSPSACSRSASEPSPALSRQASGRPVPTAGHPNW